MERAMLVMLVRFCSGVVSDLESLSLVPCPSHDGTTVVTVIKLYRLDGETLLDPAGV